MQFVLIATISIFALSFAAGLWQICRSTILHERSRIGRNAIKRITAKKKREKGDAWNKPAMRAITGRVARFVHLNDIVKDQLEKKFKRIELDLTPEEYTARQYIIIAGGILALGVCTIVKAYFVMIVVGLCIAYLLLQQRELVDGKMQQIIKEIRLELPRFVRSICQLLTSNRDITAAITSYRKVAGNTFGKELDILLMAIQTGSVSSALIQFQYRIGTDEVYRLCGALLEMERGIDQTATLQNLADDMSQQVRLNIQKELSLRPGRMRRTFIPAALFCVLMMLYSLVLYLMSELHALL